MRLTCTVCGSKAVTAEGTTDQSGAYAIGHCATCSKRVPLTTREVTRVPRPVKSNRQPEPAFPGESFAGTFTGIGGKW